MGKTSEKSTEVDPRMAAFGEDMINKSNAASEIPFLPNRGVRVAGFNDLQNAAFEGTNDMSSAFGLGTAARQEMGPMEDAGNGIMGYSTGGVYDQTKAASVPQSIQDYIDGLTGLNPDGTWNNPPPAASPNRGQQRRVQGGGDWEGNHGGPNRNSFDPNSKFGQRMGNMGDNVRDRARGVSDTIGGWFGG